MNNNVASQSSVSIIAQQLMETREIVVCTDIPYVKVDNEWVDLTSQ
jgi:hypothetical protein